MSQSNKSITIFRYIAIAEAISYLLLLFIAMPLKYMADMPVYVKIAGWIHGILFIAYMYAMGYAAYQKQWKPVKILTAMLASIIPFAPFFIEKKPEAASSGQL